MRCLSCNNPLSKFENTRKSVNTGEYIQLCNHCYEPIREQVHVIERNDLLETEMIDGDE